MGQNQSPEEIRGRMRSFGWMEPFWKMEPFASASGQPRKERQEAMEWKRMQSYYSETAAKLQRLVEEACDRMDYRGSMMYDEFPDRLMMEHTCRNIARQYEQKQWKEQNEKKKKEKKARSEEKEYGQKNREGKKEREKEREWEMEELLDLIGVLLYHEMFRRRNKGRRYWMI